MGAKDALVKKTNKTKVNQMKKTLILISTLFAAVSLNGCGSTVAPQLSGKSISTDETLTKNKISFAFITIGDTNMGVK